MEHHCVRQHYVLGEPYDLPAKARIAIDPGLGIGTQEHPFGPVVDDTVLQHFLAFDSVSVFLGDEIRARSGCCNVGGHQCFERVDVDHRESNHLAQVHWRRATVRPGLSEPTRAASFDYVHVVPLSQHRLAKPDLKFLFIPNVVEENRTDIFPHFADRLFRSVLPDFQMGEQLACVGLILTG